MQIYRWPRKIGDMLGKLRNDDVNGNEDVTNLLI